MRLERQQEGDSLVGAILAGLVLGLFVLSVVVVLVINLNQTPLEPMPTSEEGLYQIGGDL
jgi:Tfp pilus assembly protein PilW